MKFSAVDKLAIAAVIIPAVLFVFDAMPKLTAVLVQLLNSMVV